VLVLGVNVPELLQVPPTVIVLLAAATVPADIVKLPTVAVLLSVRVSGPVFVKLLLPPLITPLNAKLPASTATEDADPNVIVPLIEFAPLTLRSAPPEDMPVPFNVIASVLTAIPPCTSSAAPLVTDTPPAVVPVALTF